MNSADAAEGKEHDEHADGEKRHQLDQRLGRDREDEAVLVFGGVDVAGAEQNREGRQRHG